MSKAELAVLVADLERFKAACRGSGLHLGLGLPPVCVCCGEPWPCPHELELEGDRNG